MNYIIHFCVFIIVLLVYLHIQSHFRSADGTDVFELDGVIESRIDDVLDLKQPVVFRTRFDATLGDDINAYAVLRHIPQVDVSVVDAEHGTRVNVSLESFVKLQKTKSDTHYYSDGNEQIIQKLPKDFQKRISSYYDLLVPHLVCSKRYDLMFGTDNCVSSMRRHVSHRSYFTVTNGTVNAKLFHPEELTNMEFSYNPTIVPDSMTTIISSGQTIPTAKDVTLYTGQTLFIPPYWGVILSFNNDAFVMVSKYSTYMSEIASCMHSARFWYNKMTSHNTIIPDIHNPTKTSVDISSEQIPKKVDVSSELVSETIKEVNTKSVSHEEVTSPDPPIEECSMEETNTDAPPTVLTPHEHVTSL
jgi:hypothetical protein